jgi:hypothetical protein
MRSIISAILSHPPTDRLLEEEGVFIELVKNID